MLNQDRRNVNASKQPDRNNEDEEIMVPYSRVLYIAWDRDVGLILQALRSAKGLSQPQLASLTRGVVSEGTVQSLELGRVDSVSRKKLDALLDALGRDVRDLFPTVTVKNI